MEVTMETIESQCEMTPERCEALVTGILKSMHNGLARDGEELKMLPSFVSKLDAYHGTFYALDLVMNICTRNGNLLLKLTIHISSLLCNEYLLSITRCLKLLMRLVFT